MRPLTSSHSKAAAAAALTSGWGRASLAPRFYGVHPTLAPAAVVAIVVVVVAGALALAFGLVGGVGGVVVAAVVVVLALILAAILAAGGLGAIREDKIFFEAKPAAAAAVHLTAAHGAGDAAAAAGTAAGAADAAVAAGAWTRADAADGADADVADVADVAVVVVVALVDDEVAVVVVVVAVVVGVAVAVVATAAVAGAARPGPRLLPTTSPQILGYEIGAGREVVHPLPGVLFWTVSHPADLVENGADVPPVLYQSYAAAGDDCLDLVHIGLAARIWWWLVHGVQWWRVPVLPCGPFV